MRAMIHQNQLRGLNRYRNQVVTAEEKDFTSWLQHNVGRQDREWGRTYCLDLNTETYGTTWWFRDPAAATLTLLRWS
jgi:hypothetical protein